MGVSAKRGEVVVVEVGWLAGSAKAGRQDKFRQAAGVEWG